MSLQNKIKRIMVDIEGQRIGQVKREALAVVADALELFLKDLIQKSLHAQKKKPSLMQTKQRLSPDSILEVVQSEDIYDFLRSVKPLENSRKRRRVTHKKSKPKSKPNPASAVSLSLSSVKEDQKHTTYRLLDEDGLNNPEDQLKPGSSKLQEDDSDDFDAL